MGLIKIYFMKAHDFINKNIGRKVYLTGRRDIGIDSSLRKFIIPDMNKNVYNSQQQYLTILKLTKSGMAYLLGEDGLHYSVRPTNVRLATETETYQRRIMEMEAKDEVIKYMVKMQKIY